MPGSADGSKKDAPAREPPHLTIELVPSTCWFSNVRDHVVESDWQHIKKATSISAGARCEICGGRGDKWPVECHEVWHYDDDAHTQTLVRTQALCPACHRVKHIGLAEKQGKGEATLKHLAVVNGWVAGDARRYPVKWTPESRQKHAEFKLYIPLHTQRVSAAPLLA